MQFGVVSDISCFEGPLRFFDMLSLDAVATLSTPWVEKVTPTLMQMLGPSTLLFILMLRQHAVPPRDAW